MGVYLISFSYPKTGDRKFKQVKEVSLVNRMQGLIVLDGHILTRKCRIYIYSYLIFLHNMHKACSFLFSIS